MASTQSQIEQNKAIVREALDRVYNDADYDAMDELFASDYFEHGSPIGDIEGLEGYREWLKSIHAGFSDFTITQEFALCEDDLVASYVTYTGTHDGEFIGIPATDEFVEVSGININRIEDGKLAESWVSVDILGLLQQVGVSQVPGA